MKKAENETANAILKIADAIDGHSKSIDGLSQNIHWSFRDDFDENEFIVSEKIPINNILLRLIIKAIESL